MRIKLSRIIVPPNNGNSKSRRNLKRTVERLRKGEYEIRNPIIVQKQGDYYVLVKGYNSVLIAEELGLTEIEAEEL